MSFLSRFFSKPPVINSDSLEFDSSRYEWRGADGPGRMWTTPDGGGVSFWFFQCPPDLPSGLTSADQLRKHYEASVSDGISVVDCRIVKSGPSSAVWLIIKARNEQTMGMVFQGSLTIPFKNFSYVIKVGYREEGATGFREAVLIDEALSNKTASVEGGKLVMNGWSPDDEQFDSRFPEHPLSRVREELRCVLASIRLKPEIKRAPSFPLPPEGA